MACGRGAACKERVGVGGRVLCLWTKTKNSWPSILNSPPSLVFTPPSGTRQTPTTVPHLLVPLHCTIPGALLTITRCLRGVSSSAFGRSRCLGGVSSSAFWSLVFGGFAFGGPACCTGSLLSHLRRVTVSFGLWSHHERREENQILLW
jgi:hypothetical protein